VPDEVIEATTTTAAVHQRCRCFVEAWHDPGLGKPCPNREHHPDFPNILCLKTVGGSRFRLMRS
jgi:hypothetical protein